MELGQELEVEEFFPPRFWGLDPVFSAKVKLNIGDVLTLAPYPEFPGIYCIGNHPVLGVHVMGDVVSVKEKSALITYEVDDGSGVLNCTQWRRSKDSSDGLYVPEIGELVSVLGQVEEYREEKQLRVTAIVPERDPNSEVCHWLEVEQVWRGVYTQRFSLPDGVVESDQSREKRLWKEVLRDELMKYLRAMDGPFTLSSLSESEKVMSAMWECVRVEDGWREEGWSESEGKAVVEREARDMVKALPGMGLVVPVRATQESSIEEYELLSEKKHLFPLILGFIKHKIQHPRASRLGVPQEWIVQHIRGREGLQHVSSATVKGAIDHLEESSVIFSISDGAYKTVN